MLVFKQLFAFFKACCSIVTNINVYAHFGCVNDCPTKIICIIFCKHAPMRFSVPYDRTLRSKFTLQAKYRSFKSTSHCHYNCKLQLNIYSTGHRRLCQLTVGMHAPKTNNELIKNRFGTTYSVGE
jgi:hypothetical protein